MKKGFQVTTTTIYLLLIEITVLTGAVVGWFIHRASYSPGTGNYHTNLTLHELEEQKAVPWGWPNHQPKKPRRVGKLEVAEAMYVLMECIMMEKRLITEGDLQLKHPGISDSHLNGTRDTGTPAERPTSEHETPQAANDESIDIVDVFGRSKNVLKYSRQGQVASQQAVFRKNDSDLNFRQFEEKEILRPWGW